MYILKYFKTFTLPDFGRTELKYESPLCSYDALKLFGREEKEIERDK